MAHAKFNLPAGTNFHCLELIPVVTLSKTLCLVAAFLQNRAPSMQMHRYEDWWEHDGLHFLKETIDMHKLFLLVESPRALLEAMQGDDLVFVGISPDDASWYLRFYVEWDDDGTELFGRFDVTLPDHYCAQFKQQVMDTVNIKMKQMDAADYFTSCAR